MNVERVAAASCREPFPVYPNLVDALLAAHATETDERDATLAHVLATCAGYSYSDSATLAAMTARLGLDGNACVRVAQTVDAMFIFSTAYLIQSRCGRVVILCYRGTEPANLRNWLGDADVGNDSLRIGNEFLRVHSGVYRNMRATRFRVLEELHAALDGWSLLDPKQRVDHPMQALYVTGHSLGGAMAILFALSIVADGMHRAIGDRLRAIYTYGQPLTADEPLPEAARTVERKLFRYVHSRDVVPALPAAPWGRLAHFGHEYRCVKGEWECPESPVAQLKNLREIPRTILALFATVKKRESSRYTMADHAPHHYIAALRPRGRVTEFGDYD